HVRFVSVTIVFCSLLFFQCHASHRLLHSFPTRRSSDLLNGNALGQEIQNSPTCSVSSSSSESGNSQEMNPLNSPNTDKDDEKSRSEEHTSELQSRFDLVCRLLLEKKKKKKKKHRISNRI